MTCTARHPHLLKLADFLNRLLRNTNEEMPIDILHEKLTFVQMGLLLNSLVEYYHLEYEQPSQIIVSFAD